MPPPIDPTELARRYIADLPPGVGLARAKDCRRHAESRLARASPEAREQLMATVAYWAAVESELPPAPPAPRPPPRRRIDIRLPPELLDLVDASAEAEGCDRTAWIVEACERRLRSH